MAKKKEQTAGENLARAIIQEYKPQSVSEMQNALKDIFGPMFEAMLQGELDAHLGYESNEHGEKETQNRRNGYGHKKLLTSNGEVEIKTPRDRDGSFEPKLIPKRRKNISEIENKVLSMYAKGMSQRDIALTIEDIYGFSISAETVSQITNRVMDELEEWQNRPLEKMYTVIFVDCMYVKIRKDYVVKECAVYNILGYTLDGHKEILGIWLSETESKHMWMQIFDELKARGVEDVLFVCMDGLKGLEEGAKSVFPKATIQRCIVHLIRNSLKYVPSKDFKAFVGDLKKMYTAPSLKVAQSSFEKIKITWSMYPGAIAVWSQNFGHIEQLFDYGSAVRKIMYTTNAIESIHSSYRKVVKKGAFPNENAVLKALFLRTKELLNKWHERPIPNWSMVRNQLFINDDIAKRISQYDTQI